MIFDRFSLKSAAWAAALFLAGALHAQITPKTVDGAFEVAPDGSATVTFMYSYDAGPWNQWKAYIGDNPSRLRAMMRYNFGADVAFDGFKMERDDLNRTAKVVMHSAVGCELRNDGRFSVPVGKEFRLVSNSGGTWFFTGEVANTISTVRYTLPAGAIEPGLINVGDQNQALIYSLPRPPGKAHKYVLAGGGLFALGVLLLAVGCLKGKRPVGQAGPS